MSDRSVISRFVAAQDAVYEDVLQELRTGQKTSHWIWYVFPQLTGLGHSLMSQRFALSGAEKARAYLAHPQLGWRLRECTRLIIEIKDRNIFDILGSPDDMKFHSCMTLFNAVVSIEPLWREALDLFFAGEPDTRTLSMLHVHQ